MSVLVTIGTNAQLKQCWSLQHRWKVLIIASLWVRIMLPIKTKAINRKGVFTILD